MSDMFDFEDRKDPVPAHCHINRNGEIGGWVAETVYAGPNTIIEENARVYGNAQVYDDTRIFDSAQVFDNAVVSGHAVISDNSKVYDNGFITNSARVMQGKSIRMELLRANSGLLADLEQKKI